MYKWVLILPRAGVCIQFMAGSCPKYISISRSILTKTVDFVGFWTINRFRHAGVFLVVFLLLSHILPLSMAQQNEGDSGDLLLESSNSVTLYMNDGYELNPAAPQESDSHAVTLALPTLYTPYRFLPWLSYYQATELGEWKMRAVQNPLMISGRLEFHIWVASPTNENDFYFNFTLHRNGIPLAVPSQVRISSLTANQPVHAVAYRGLPAPVNLMTGDVLSLIINCTITSSSNAYVYMGSRQYNSGVKIESSDSIAVNQVATEESAITVNFLEKFGIQAGTMFYKAILDGFELEVHPTITQRTDMSSDAMWFLDEPPDPDAHHQFEVQLGYNMVDNITFKVQIFFPDEESAFDLGKLTGPLGIIIFFAIVVGVPLYLWKLNRKKKIEAYRDKLIDRRVRR